MKRLGPKMRAFVVLTIFFTLSFMILAGASFVGPRHCTGAVTCDPTIQVTNLSWFGELLKKTAYNYMINQAKAAVISKLNLEFLPGGFANILMGELADVSDLSGKIESVMNGGLQNELAYIQNQMSAESLKSTLNSTMENTLASSLSSVSGLTDADIKGLVSDYKSQFLTTSGAFSTYAGSATEYQSMMAGFVSNATGFTSTISNLGTKIDIADFVKSGTGLGSIINTQAVVNEANSYIQNGIQNVVQISGYDVGVSIESSFASMNTDYLRTKLENMVQTSSTGKNTPLFTKEQVDKIVEETNKAASSSVASYLTKTSNSVTQQAAALNSTLQNSLKTSVGAAEKVIQGAISTEKLQDSLAQTASNKVQESLQSVIGDSGKWFSAATDGNPLSYIFSAGGGDDSGKIALILAGSRDKTTAVKANVKYWMVAKESADAVKNIQTKMKKYSPATIDSKYEDAAWKDAARFQYYALMLQNQQLKLLAVRAIARAVNQQEGSVDLKNHITKEGLPSGF